VGIVLKNGARRPVSRVLFAPPACGRRRETAIPLGRALRHASRDQPGRRDGNVPASRPFRKRRRPPLFGLAPGGVYPAAPVTGGAVRSYRTVSPLPAAHGFPWRAGGLFSVALSLGSPPPVVNRHRIPVEPGLSSNVAGSPGTSAAVRPSGMAGMGAGMVVVNGRPWKSRGRPLAQLCVPVASRSIAASRARVPASGRPVTASGRQWR
jgi:hypothetical protein